MKKKNFSYTETIPQEDDLSNSPTARIILTNINKLGKYCIGGSSVIKMEKSRERSEFAEGGLIRNACGGKPDAIFLRGNQPFLT